MNRARLIVVFLLLTGTVAGGEEAPPRDWNLSKALIKLRAVREAESIVLARIREVHRSPGVWCGFVVTKQEVTYEVMEHLHGKEVSGRVRIGHLLVSGTGTVLKDKPHVVFTAVERGETEARARFRYDAESVVGEARLERTEGGWRVAEVSVKES